MLAQTLEVLFTHSRLNSKTLHRFGLDIRPQYRLVALGSVVKKGYRHCRPATKFCFAVLSLSPHSVFNGDY